MPHVDNPPVARITPWYEYPINRFDMAVRDLESCECETMPCEHVGKYNGARAGLCDAFIKKCPAWAPDRDVIYRRTP